MANGSKIIVDHASKLFLEGSVIAFRNVDLQIRNQEVLCVVGPSGLRQDNFTALVIEPNAVTADGMFGIFFGHTFIITESEPECVDGYPWELTVVT